jgi:hypothetical protein
LPEFHDSHSPECVDKKELPSTLYNYIDLTTIL